MSETIAACLVVFAVVAWGFWATFLLNEFSRDLSKLSQGLSDLRRSVGDLDSTLRQIIRRAAP